MKPYLYPGPKRLAAAASLAGFPDRVLATAVAVCGAETSGNAWAVSVPGKGGIRRYGAWQVPEEALPGTADEQWANYVDNARMAYRVYTSAEGSFQPWPGYYSGRYKDRTGPHTQRPGVSWLDWAGQGVADLRADLAKGRTLEVIASVYLEV